jgi:hypothetical protein
MKMVKSLLLGSAAGIVAVAGAQAADLPVKAKPVEYVKICSLYGAGYYYMPGTDICLKLGGYVRYQLNVGAGNNISGGPQHGTGGRNNRIDENEVMQRVRALLTIDTRQQTAYGTLRSYLLLGYSHDVPTSGAAALYVSRGFIQIAGFTFGKATSFFDIFPNASFAYNAGNNFSGDSGDGGVILMSYTAQFGNGFSGTIAIEQARRLPSVLAVGAPFTIGGNPTANNLGGAGGTYPDIVGNLRLDQSWGTWIVAAAAHDMSGGYWGATEAAGHPSDDWGWAVTTGFILNLPMITPGDRFSVQAVYSEGATAYHAATRSTAAPLFASGTPNVGGNGRIATGFWTDGVFGVGGQVIPTTAWSINAGFEHLWTPSFKTSIYGSYIDVSHSAGANALMCATNTAATSSIVLTAFCNMDWQGWTIGSRSEWEPIKGFTVGADIIYAQIDGIQSNAVTNTVILGAASGAKPAGTYQASDLGVLSGSFRVQRNFLP